MALPQRRSRRRPRLLGGRLVAVALAAALVASYIHTDTANTLMAYMHTEFLEALVVHAAIVVVCAALRRWAFPPELDHEHDDNDAAAANHDALLLFPVRDGKLLDPDASAVDLDVLSTSMPTTATAADGPRPRSPHPMRTKLLASSGDADEQNQNDRLLYVPSPSHAMHHATPDRTLTDHGDSSRPRAPPTLWAWLPLLLFQALALWGSFVLRSAYLVGLFNPWLPLFVSTMRFLVHGHCSLMRLLGMLAVSLGGHLVLFATNPQFPADLTVALFVDAALRAVALLHLESDLPRLTGVRHHGKTHVPVRDILGAIMGTSMLVTVFNGLAVLRFNDWSGGSVLVLFLHPQFLIGDLVFHLLMPLFVLHDVGVASSPPAASRHVPAAAAAAHAGPTGAESTTLYLTAATVVYMCIVSIAGDPLGQLVSSVGALPPAPHVVGAILVAMGTLIVSAQRMRTNTPCASLLRLFAILIGLCLVILAFLSLLPQFSRPLDRLAPAAAVPPLAFDDDGYVDDSPVAVPPRAAAPAPKASPLQTDTRAAAFTASAVTSTVCDAFRHHATPLDRAVHRVKGTLHAVSRTTLKGMHRVCPNCIEWTVARGQVLLRAPAHGVPWDPSVLALAVLAQDVLRKPGMPFWQFARGAHADAAALLVPDGGADLVAAVDTLRVADWHAKRSDVVTLAACSVTLGDVDAMCRHQYVVVPRTCISAAAGTQTPRGGIARAAAVAQVLACGSAVLAETDLDAAHFTHLVRDGVHYFRVNPLVTEHDADMDVPVDVAGDPWAAPAPAAARVTLFRKWTMRDVTTAIAAHVRARVSAGHDPRAGTAPTTPTAHNPAQPTPATAPSTAAGVLVASAAAANVARRAQLLMRHVSSPLAQRCYMAAAMSAYQGLVAPDVVAQVRDDPDWDEDEAAGRPLPMAVDQLLLEVWDEWWEWRLRG
ncbi:hypothetical protein AMAG_01976 [Allomyces macrogynus ATCC 38327]|uniref:Uncharacterized protein n=1 Tax=Allomyces macrogynus (strain ATCC 38327) TaxID=578462 RepID=A0A0L0S161_ALLM3|nr:hypothetical protein AMAG_01976 [Allomyces macrogynus ATCC 38327]|eukprot:KNE56140.1 hypothetical protein AMAG_01976 [Allomyces macrogynus ATCC 38327]